ncbi:FAD/NAD(P)-binding domain-containing protein [Scenedesmus sp. NREL 46B-D3]|nr:FAD/NAD(P)-binding domain-containing protein [Scenedesmus sp. NREL 46B-D3]
MLDHCDRFSYIGVRGNASTQVAEHLRSNQKASSSTYCQCRPISGMDSTTLGMDVVIIGGGPGGLAAALALHKAAPQLKVAVYERCPALSRRGAGLGLDVNGQKALRAIDPAVHVELLKQAAFLKTQRVLAADGTLVKETEISKNRQEFEQQGYRTPCLLGWYEIQQMLLRALPQSTAVQLGSEFDHYDQDASTGLLTVHFKGSQQPPVQAGLLVAADGYFSRVRRQAVGDGPPSYGKTVVWRARLPAASAVVAGLDLQDSSSAFVQDSGRFFFAYPINSGDYVWTVGVSGCHVTAMFVLVILCLWPNTILQSCRDMTPAAYGSGRVLVMGDAAHPLRPTGQGLNQAMEDAWGVGAALAGAAAVGQPQLAAVQEFRQQRAQRMRTIVAYTTASGEAAYKRSMDNAQAEKAMGPDTAIMSADKFLKFCYDVAFEDLTTLLAQEQLALAG